MSIKGDLTWPGSSSLWISCPPSQAVFLIPSPFGFDKVESVFQQARSRGMALGMLLLTVMVDLWKRFLPQYASRWRAKAQVRRKRWLKAIQRRPQENRWEPPARISMLESHYSRTHCFIRAFPALPYLMPALSQLYYYICTCFSKHWASTAVTPRGHFCSFPLSLHSSDSHLAEGTRRDAGNVLLVSACRFFQTLEERP